MKKYMLLALMFAAPAANARVFNAVAPSTSTSQSAIDSYLSTLWNDTLASPNFHLLDNATTAYCRDVIHGRDLGCATSSLYQKDYVSADFGIAGSQQTPNGGPTTYSGFPMLAVNFHFGQLLAARIPKIGSMAAQLGASGSVMSNMTVGGWAARDFNRGQYVGGFFTGFKFGNVQN